LLIAFKPQFLETARHYAELGENSRQFAAFLTYAALDPVDGYTVEDFQAAIGALQQEGLQEAAQALSQALEGAGEQREEYWKNRIQPFWQHVWPKSRDLASNGIAESLARMSIAGAHLKLGGGVQSRKRRIQPLIDPRQAKMQEMIEAGCTPTHTHALEPLLNKPFAGAFHEPAADRPAVSLELWVIEMRLMGVEIVLEIGEGPTCRFGQRWRGEQRLQLCRDLRLAPVA
jgi:hypothetical protein